MGPILAASVGTALAAAAAGLVAVAVAAEVVLRRAVARARPVFPWVVTAADDRPRLDPERVARYVAGTFSRELGWCPVPGSSGEDRVGDAGARFAIDERGARRDPHGLTPTVAAFGDSYVFCRQVDDDGTWPAQLADVAGIGVMNLGVGNHGVDQSLLRLRATELPDSVHTVVLGFVPETIRRVTAMWKHWSEFGNTFGFKPRFTLDADGRLVLHPTPVTGVEGFLELDATLARIGDLDDHRRGWYARHRFGPVHLVTFLRHPARHAAILATVTEGLRRAGPDGALPPDAFDRAFARVMRDNVRASHRAYRDPATTALLAAILTAFVDEVRARGRACLVVVLPQRMDLDLAASAARTYRPWFARLAERLPVVDLTDVLAAHPRETTYVNDRYGGHLSVAGNRLVAEALAPRLATREVARGG